MVRNRSAVDPVVEMMHRGLSNEDIRQDLKAKGTKAARISQLLSSAAALRSSVAGSTMLGPADESAAAARSAEDSLQNANASEARGASVEGNAPMARHSKRRTGSLSVGKSTAAKKKKPGMAVTDSAAAAAAEGAARISAKKEKKRAKDEARADSAATAAATPSKEQLERRSPASRVEVQTQPSAVDYELTQKQGAVAFTAWSMTDARVAQAKLQTWMNNIGNLSLGPSWISLQILVDQIPDEVCIFGGVAILKKDTMQKKAWSAEPLRMTTKTFAIAVDKFIALAEGHDEVGGSETQGLCISKPS